MVVLMDALRFVLFSFSSPDAIDYTVDQAPHMLADRQHASDDAPRRLEAEIKRERRQLERLVDAVAKGKAPAAVLEKIRALEASIATNDRELATLQIMAPTELEVARIERGFRTRLDQFNEPAARRELEGDYGRTGRSRREWDQRRQRTGRRGHMREW